MKCLHIYIGRPIILLYQPTQKENKMFNFLSQCNAVQNVLNAAVAALDKMPDSQEKTALIESMNVFENTVAVTVCSIDDVIGEISRSEGINPEDIKESDCINALNNMVDNHHQTDEDWEIIRQSYEFVTREPSMFSDVRGA